MIPNLSNLRDQITRLRAAERSGMVLSVDDVEALVAAIEAQREQARQALFALLEHDLDAIRDCCHKIQGGL